MGVDSRLLEGEIVMSGSQVGRGYLGDAALTAAKFCVDEEGVRHFYTGDKGSWSDATGDLLILGRVDSQVKLRGFRIELGEIESVILECDYIEACSVMLTGTPPALGAVIISTLPPESWTSCGELAVSLHCQSSLPLHQVPSYFALMENLPLLENGKLDKTMILTQLELKRLSISESNHPNTADGVPEIDFDQVENEDVVPLTPLPSEGGDTGIPGVPDLEHATLKIERTGLEVSERPSVVNLSLTDGSQQGILRTEMERLVAMVWSEALGVSDMGPFSHFFNSGGNSLTAMRMLTLLQKSLHEHGGVGADSSLEIASEHR